MAGAGAGSRDCLAGGVAAFELGGTPSSQARAADRPPASALHGQPPKRVDEPKQAVAEVAARPVARTYEGDGSGMESISLSLSSDGRARVLFRR